MKQTKRKKPGAPKQIAVVDSTALPDSAYVEQLLASPVAEAAVVANEVLSESSANGVLTLPAQCVLRDVVEYRQRLLNYVAAPAVAIDAAGVERIDTAFIQVLLAFVRSRANGTQGVSWLSHSPAFAEAVATLGLQALLAVPELSAAA